MATPTFAAMAALTWLGGASAPVALCGGLAGGGSDHGMIAMYVLMALFHLGPWIGLARDPPSMRITQA